MNKERLLATVVKGLKEIKEANISQIIDIKNIGF